MGGVWLLLLALTVSGTDLLTAELKVTEELIALYEQKLGALKAMRQELVAADVHLPNETDFAVFQAHEASQTHLQSTLEQLFLRKSDLTLSEDLTDFDIFALTTGTREIGILALCHRSGLVALHETTGKAMGNFTVAGGSEYCTGFATSEELSVAVASGSSLTLSSVKPQGPGSLQVLRQLTIQTTGKPTGIRVSNRGAKRLWIVADDAGKLSAYHFNGTLLRTTTLSQGALVGLENSGYSFLAADQRQLSVINPASGEVVLRCDKTLKDISGFAVDGSPIASVLLADNTLMIFDTQYSAGGGVGSCKALAYLQSKYFTKGSKVASFPGATLVLNEDGVMTYVNTTFSDTDKGTSMYHVTFPALGHSSNSHIKVHKTGFGSILLGVSVDARILLFEVLSTYRPASSEAWLDFGLIRIGAIVAAVLFVLYWNSRKSGASGKQAEQLQSKLGKLERKMRETQQYGEQIKRKMDTSGLKELSRKLAEDQD